MENKVNFTFEEIIEMIERGVRRIEGEFITKKAKYKLVAYKVQNEVIRIDLKK